jgi:acetyl-CoA carboxylase biotin carboxyl carrier protein
VNLSGDDVQEILRLLDAIDVDELRLETERFKLTLRRADGAWTQERQVLSPPDAAAPGPGPPASTVGPRPPPPPPPPPLPTSTRGAVGALDVRAPLPGTFYRAPRPGAAPFVDVGGRVERDAVVGIVETMKLMNPVLAGVSGTVVEICLADAHPVEQGAVLLRIEPGPR